MRLVSSTGGGCTLDVDVTVAAFVETGQGWMMDVSGFEPSFEEGDILRPSLTLVIPLPPDVTPDLTVTPGGSVPVDPPGAPAYAPVQHGTGLATSWRPSEPSTAAVPRDLGELRVTRLAGTRVALVTLYPFTSASPSSVPEGLRVELEWPETAGGVPVSGPLLPGVCPPGVLFWPDSPEDPGESPFWGMPWARIELSGSGLYALTGSELDAAGCELLGTPSSSLRMLTGPGVQYDVEKPGEEHQPVEVALEVVDGGDGSFDAADSLIWYGRALERLVPSGMLGMEMLSHAYAERNVYWLTWGGGDGLRMTREEALPDGSPEVGPSLPHYVWQEREYTWLPHRETRTGWAWTQLFEGVPGFFYFSTPSPEGGGTLAVSLLTDATGPHEAVFQLNGSTLAETSWVYTGETELVFRDLELDPSVNLLKVTYADGPGQVWLNHFQVSYPRSLDPGRGRLLLTNPLVGPHTLRLGGAAEGCRLLDLTDPCRPVALDGRLADGTLSFSRELVPSSAFIMARRDDLLFPDTVLADPPGRILGTGVSGDVAVVCADTLMGSAPTIEAIYAARGLSAAVVSLSEVYDEFGQGVPDPGAVRSFLRHAQESWPEQVRALLLVGDGTYDPLMRISAVPTLMPVWIELGHSDGLAADDFYAMTHESSTLPELPVSRIPSSSPTELSAYLGRLIRYDSSPPSGVWRGRAVLLADDEWGRGSNVGERVHTWSCDSLAEKVIPRLMQRDKLYLVEYPWPPGTSQYGIHPEKPEAREDLVELLGEGCASLTFFGHGSYGQIAHEKVLVSSDADRLGNGDRLPVAVFASCDVAHFDLVSADCMSEELLNAAGGGAIAVIAATRGTYSYNNEYLFKSYYEVLYGEDAPTIGEALWAAKVMGTGSYSNHMKYVVLGDGGLTQVRPDDEGCSLVVEGDTLRRGRMATVEADIGRAQSAMVRVTESGGIRTYNCLGGMVLEYMGYGAPIYSGMVHAEEGLLSADFFVPVQADTGSCARAGASGLPDATVAWLEWVGLVDRGGYRQDETPPEVDTWIEGYRYDDSPEVPTDATLRIAATDSSGICSMGGGAGRSILMSLDSRGLDLSRWFQYLPDSYTSGELSYPLPELAEGPHRAVVVLWDGVGNSARDTLDFVTVDLEERALSDVLVYPSPGCGRRCFSFMAGAGGTVTVSVYTVAGRRIWERTVECGAGYNQVVWDGLDADGDPPATGAYIFRVRLEGPEGSGSHTGVLANVREGT